MIKHCLFFCASISLFSILAVPQSQPSKLTKAIIEAQKEIKLYLSKARASDKRNFGRYLEYYRSEGGYAAVTPAPYHVQAAISPEARVLFRKLKDLAYPFTRTPKPMPGASKLTPEGEQFYTAVLNFYKNVM